MENNLTYIQNGDYLIPDLHLSEQPEKPLGKYGRMRKAYLKQHRPILYNQLLQVRFAHPAVLAQGLLRLLAQAQVGNQVVPVLNVSQVVLHVWHSFPRSWRAHSSGW